MAARQAHNLEVPGSSPGPAILSGAHMCAAENCPEHSEGL